MYDGRTKESPWRPSPLRDDKFTFGLWTVGWPARDPFGDATRPPLDPVETVHRLAELGAYGVTFHDDDLIPFGTDAAERDRLIARFREALDETGLVVPMVTTNLFTHPVFKDGGFTSNDRAVRRFALRKVLRNLDLAAELGAKTYVFWGGREGAEYDAAKDIRAALDRYREGIDLLADYVNDQGYDIRFAIEPKPNEPRGDILLPTVGHALAFIAELEHADMVGLNPEVGHEQMAGLNFAARHRPGAVAGQALPHRPQRPARHQVRPGPGLRPRRPAQRVLAWSTCWRTAARTAARPTTARGTSTTSRSRTEDVDGVWASAAANMRTYLLLKERAAAFRADPEVQRGARRRQGRRAARRRRWRRARPTPTCSPTAARSRTSTPTTAGERGYGFVRLHQLALEHLLGAR